MIKTNAGLFARLAVAAGELISAELSAQNAHVTVVEDAGHSLPKEYVGALLDRWLD